MNDIGILGEGGMLPLVIGGWSGLFRCVSLGKPKGWARVKEWTRMRQGHVDALVVGAVFMATDALATTGPVTSAALLVSGYCIAISTGAPAWWPDSPVRSP